MNSGYVPRTAIFRRPSAAPMRGRILFAVAAALIFLGIRPAMALTINPVFDSSITSATNAAEIETTIDEVIRTYESLFSNPIDVSVTFVSTNTGLGLNETSYVTDTYTDFLAKLTADQSTAYNVTALAHLPAGPDNPVNGNPDIDVTQANAEALGIFSPNTAASTIYLNTSLMDVSRTIPIQPTQYDLFYIVEHELDEVLGTSSSLVNGSNGDPAPTGPIFAMDLFRYDQNGNRSYTTSSNAEAFLSIDGTTDLAQYNQISNTAYPGDFGDYDSYTQPAVPQVQDAYGTPGVTLNLGPPEEISLNVVGYGLLTSVTWDPSRSGTSNPPDGAGTWTTGGSNVWFNSSSDAAWSNGGTAQFGSTSSISTTQYTVTLGSNITVGTLIFTNQTYTLSSSTNSLTIADGIISVANAVVASPVILSGDNGWDAVGAALLTVSGNVSGGYLLSKQGPGMLALGGSNSYSGEPRCSRAPCSWMPRTRFRAAAM